MDSLVGGLISWRVNKVSLWRVYPVDSRNLVVSLVGETTNVILNKVSFWKSRRRVVHATERDRA